MVGNFADWLYPFLYLVKTQHLAIFAPENQCFLKIATLQGQTLKELELLATDAQVPKTSSVEVGRFDMGIHAIWTFRCKISSVPGLKFKDRQSFYQAILLGGLSQKFTKGNQKQQWTFNSCTCQISRTLPEIIVWWKKSPHFFVRFLEGDGIVLLGEGHKYV